MWRRPPFSISDDDAIYVRNLAAAREWYKEKLGLRHAKTDREDDSGRPFADLHVSGKDTFLSLVELESGASRKIGMSFSLPRIWKGRTNDWQDAGFQSSRLRLIRVETACFDFRI